MILRAIYRFFVRGEKGCEEYGRRMKVHLKRAESKQVLELFDELRQKHQIKPSLEHYLLAMRAVNYSKERDQADRLSRLIREDRSVSNDIQIQTGLVYMYAVALGDLSYAEKLVESIEKPHMNLFATLMTGYIRRHKPEKAIEVYDSVAKNCSLMPTVTFYNAMLNACTKLQNFPRGKELIHQILAENNPIFVQNTTLLTTILDLLGKSGNDIELCVQLFHSIPKTQRTPFFYNAMMNAYNKSDQPSETLRLFDEIDHPHDPVHYILVFNACAKLGHVCLKDAHRFYQIMLEQVPKYARRPQCRNAAIDMFGKCADIVTARQMFESNQDLNDVVSWGAILNTYAVHADGRQVLELFERMQKETKIKLNAQIYTTVLNACSHSGLLGEAKEIFTRYDIQLPERWKYVIMVDALARADQLDEALVLIDKYELVNSPSMTMYMSILSCARNRGLVQLAERTVQRLKTIKTFRSEELKPAYVLLANLYNAQNRREDAFRIRQLMREKKMKKNPGLTWVNINGTIHEFRANDRRHARMSEIYDEVARIDEELKQEGHIVDSNSVPSGSIHSEKLAIALALISTPTDSSIVLTKNLRVCPDCHEMAKRMSKLRKREIIIRDSFRYHTFTDGQCSCGDFL